MLQSFFITQGCEIDFVILVLYLLIMSVCILHNSSKVILCRPSRTENYLFSICLCCYKGDSRYVARLLCCPDISDFSNCTSIPQLVIKFMFHHIRIRIIIVKLTIIATDCAFIRDHVKQLSLFVQNLYEPWTNSYLIYLSHF